MKFAAIAASLTLALFSNCAGAAAMSCPDVIYVSVTNHSLSVNGQEVPLGEVGEKLQSLKQSAKYVFYYRENAQTEPTSEEWGRVKRVLDAMISLKLPISLSSKPDFSDAIDGQGNSHPRNSCPSGA